MELSETTGKIEGRKEADGRLTLRVGGAFYSQFLNNRELSEDTKQSMQDCQIGETWDIGWIKGGDKGQFRNIITMGKILDVNEDVSTSAPEPGRKDDFKPELSLIQTLTNCSTQIYVAKIGAGEDKGIDEGFKVIYDKIEAIVWEKLGQ